MNAPPAEMTCIAEYFDLFLPQMLGKALLPDVRALTARFAVVLREDSHCKWTLDVRKGVLAAVSKDGTTPDCRFVVTAPALIEIVAGRLAPQQAFFQKRVDISGDIALGLKTAGIMAQFFRKFPFTRN